MDGEDEMVCDSSFSGADFVHLNQQMLVSSEGQGSGTEQNALDHPVKKLRTETREAVSVMMSQGYASPLKAQGDADKKRAAKAIHKRLLTYKRSRWDGGSLQELLRSFAAHGWICVSFEMLQCVCCKSLLSVSLNSDFTCSFVQSAKKLIDNIVNAHDPMCMMRHSKDVEVLEEPEEYRQTLFSRYNSMKSLQLFDVNINVPKQLSPENILPFQFDSQEITALAGCGWTKCGFIENAVECSYCERIIQLGDCDIFCPQSEHYVWCARITESQDGTSAWERELKSAVNFFRLNRKRTLGYTLEMTTKKLKEAVSPQLSLHQ